MCAEVWSGELSLLENAPHSEPIDVSKEALTGVSHVKENSRRRCPALFYLTVVYLSVNNTKSPWPCVFNLHTELRTALHRNDLPFGDAGLVPPHQDLTLTKLVQGAGLHRLWWHLDIVHCPWYLSLNTQMRHCLPQKANNFCAYREHPLQQLPSSINMSIYYRVGKYTTQIII